MKYSNKKIMGSVEVTKDAIQAPSMGALVTKVKENPYAIGYASYGHVGSKQRPNRCFQS